MGVSATHPQYTSHVPRWELTTDVVNTTVEKYLRKVDPNDFERNKEYVNNAILTNFTSRTKQGLIGAVYRLAPEVDLSSTIDYLIEDATGSSLTLNQLSKAIVGDVLETGRVGLLIEYPKGQGNQTVEELERNNSQARIIKYESESIINQHTVTVNGKTKLDLVVIQETSETLAEDGFTWVQEVQYRALRLIDGLYEQQLYDESEDLIETFIPTKQNGERWTEIPFVFIGSEDNDSNYDNAPLYDLALVNIGHYRDSANFQESIYFTGQPTLVLNIGDMHADDWHKANPKGAIMGSRNGILVGTSGSATLLQASPNQLADEAMRRKEEQMVMIGARIITPNSGVETAEAARIRHGSENSVLANIVHNVSTGLTDAINFASEFMGSGEEENIYELNDMFFDDTIDPQMIMASIQLMDRGVLAKADIRAQLRTVGMIDPDRTDEEIDGEAELLDPIE